MLGVGLAPPGIIVGRSCCSAGQSLKLEDAVIVTHIDENGNAKSVLRCGHKCYARRNMSFIEIEYEKNGKWEWFRILPEDMERLLAELPDYRAKNVVELTLEYDIDITPEMERQWMIEEFGREIAQEEIADAMMEVMSEIGGKDG